MNSEVRERKLFYPGSPLRTTQLQEGERHHQAPSAALGPCVGPAEPQAAVAPCHGSHARQLEWLGRWPRRSPPGDLPQQGAVRPRGPGWATCCTPLRSPAASIPPSSFPGCLPGDPPRNGRLRKGARGAFAWRSGDVFPLHPGQPRTSLQRGGGLPFHSQGAALKTRIPKGLGLSGERNKKGIYFCKHETKIKNEGLKLMLG